MMMVMYTGNKVNPRHNLFFLSWGSSAEGKLGLGYDIKTDVYVPTKIDLLDGKNVVHIACGTDHSAALTGTVPSGSF